MALATRPHLLSATTDCCGPATQHARGHMPMTARQLLPGHMHLAALPAAASSSSIASHGALVCGKPGLDRLLGAWLQGCSLHMPPTVPLATLLACTSSSGIAFLPSFLPACLVLRHAPPPPPPPPAAAAAAAAAAHFLSTLTSSMSNSRVLSIMPRLLRTKSKARSPCRGAELRVGERMVTCLVTGWGGMGGHQQRVCSCAGHW
jgi:hypothetical protein